MNNKTKAEKINQCVMLNLIQHLQRLPLLLVKNMRRRFQIKFGMAHLYNNGGFTLIELLVVVLIIGILAAVAVPQYQVAIVKSRVGSMLPLLASLSQAQETHYLSNGYYTTMISALDVETPQTCTKIGEDENVLKCGKYFLLKIASNGNVNLNYCPDKNHSETDCYDTRTVHISFRSQHYEDEPNQAGTRHCSVYHKSKLAQAVCASLGMKTVNK